MKKFLALILIVLLSITALCGCSSTPADGTSDDDNAIAAGENENSGEDQNDGNAAASADLPGTYEIAATDPHYIIATPDWHAEGYGCGFALNEDGNKDYAIVVACGYGTEEEQSLQEAFTALYNDTFNGILMQNYRAKYAEFSLATTDVTLADGSSALRFEGVQSADDYGTELNCPVYGYGFSYDGVPFIVASIVMNEDAADDAKRSEMQGYVDEMVNTVRAA